jgi:hypothetical protein
MSSRRRAAGSWEIFAHIFIVPLIAQSVTSLIPFYF